MLAACKTLQTKDADGVLLLDWDNLATLLPDRAYWKKLHIDLTSFPPEGREDYKIEGVGTVNLSIVVNMDGTRMLSERINKIVKQRYEMKYVLIPMAARALEVITKFTDVERPTNRYYMCPAAAIFQNMVIEQQIIIEKGMMEIMNTASMKFSVLITDRQTGDRAVSTFDTFLQLALQRSRQPAATVEAGMTTRLQESLQTKFGAQGKDLPGNVESLSTSRHILRCSQKSRS
jgi:hypothetical protein